MVKNRTLAALLAVSVFIALLAGCAPTPAATPVPAPAPTAAPAPAPSAAAPAAPATAAPATAAPAPAPTAAPPAKADPIPITWLSFYGPETNDTYPQKFLEEKFNIKITNMLIDRMNWNDQLNPKLASGEIPDIFWLWSGTDLNNYAKQGILMEMTKEEIVAKMPGYAKCVEEIEPRLWLNATGDDGKLYGVPLYWFNGAIPQSPVYNKKWLDKLSLQVPKTMDEYVTALTKFAKEDPDGNGKDDTYGISFRGKDAFTQTMMQVFWGHGVMLDNFVPSDADPKVLERSFMTQGWKDAMTIIQKLYKDGVIDPESLTDDNLKLTQKFASGRVGVLENGNWYHWLPVSGNYRLAADNAGVELAFGHLPTMPGYYRTSAVPGGVNNSPIGMGVQVGKDQAKKDKIYEILEALHSDQETYIATVFGKEGDTYTVKDGAYIKDPKVGDAIQGGTKYGLGAFYSMFSGGKSKLLMHNDYTAEETKLRDFFLEDTNVIMPYFLGGLPSSPKYPDLSTMVTEHLIKFVTCEYNLEKDLEDFKAKYLAEGGADLTKEATALFKAQNP